MMRAVLQVMSLMLQLSMQCNAADNSADVTDIQFDNESIQIPPKRSEWQSLLLSLFSVCASLLVLVYIVFVFSKQSSRYQRFLS